MSIRTGASGSLITAFLLCASPALAAQCWVPSNDYSSIQAAVDDPTCTDINLAPGYYHGDVVIGRSLRMVGGSPDTTAVVGTVTVQGETSEAVFNGFHIEVQESGLPFNGLMVVGNARVFTSGGTLFVGLTDFLFVDGFESGDTSAWSATVP